MVKELTDSGRRTLNVRFSPDGTMLAGAGENVGTVIWNVSNWKVVEKLQPSPEVGAACVAFSPDGKWLAVGQRDHRIAVWDLATKTQTADLEMSMPTAPKITFSPDGKLLASFSQDNAVKLWDTQSWQLRRSLGPHRRSIKAVEFSPDGRLLASASTDRTVKLWNPITGEEIATFTDEESQHSALAFTPDGKTIVTVSGDRGIVLWDVATRRKIRTLKGHESTAFEVSVSSDGRFIASASQDGTVRLWSAQNHLEPDREFLPVNREPSYSRAFSPDRNSFAAGTTNNLVRRFDTATLQETGTLPVKTDDLSRIALSPGGLLLAVGRSNGVVELWDFANRLQVSKVVAHDVRLGRMLFSPDGKKLITTAVDGDLKIWAFANGTQIRPTTTLREEVFGRPALSSDGALLAFPFEGNKVKLWNLALGSEEATVEAPAMDGLGASFSDDNKWLAIWGWDYEVYVYDLRTRQRTTTLKARRGGNVSIAFSADSMRVATSNGDEPKLWDLVTHQELFDFKGAGVLVQLLSIDDNTFVTSSFEGVRLWRAPAFAEIEARERDHAPAESRRSP